MRHVALGLLLAGATLAVPALAQDGPAHGWANVDATVNWSKDILVEENVSREKAVYFRATPLLRGAGGGEASAAATVGNAESVVSNAARTEVSRHDDGLFTLAMTAPLYATRNDAMIKDAINFNGGIMQVNQDTGVMANQGNLLSTASSEVFGTGSNLGDAQVEIEQYNTTNTIVRNCILGCDLEMDVEGVYGKFGSVRKSSLLNAVNANVGIVNVNQNSGEMNNQTNGNAVGIGADGAVMLGEAALGQSIGDNLVNVYGHSGNGSIANSINNNVAQVSVNQSSGAGNNQSSSFHFSSWLSFSTPGVTATRY